MASEQELQRLQLKVELTEKNANALLKEAEALNKSAKSLKDKVAAEEAATAAAKALIEFLEVKAEALEKSGNNAMHLRREVAELQEVLKTAAPETKALAEALKDATGAADQLITPFGKMIGLASEFDQTLAGTAASILNTGDATNILNEQLKKTFDISNFAAAGIEQVIKGSINLTKAQDAALVQFAKNGGNVEKYGKELMDLEQAMFTAGISVEEAGESFLSLNRDFTDLRNLTPAVRTDLAKTTAVLNELGISSDITAENLQFMTKALGVSATQAAETQRELFVLARTIDMPPEAMAQAFSDAMPKLSAFGSESTDVFKKLQVNARAAGMEVSDVLSIVEQFDTFDGAAQSVGRLNALLGGPFLDSLEMVTTTDPTERMKMLSDAVNEAGVAFDDMSYYQRKALADTLGMDIPQLAMMMANGFDAAVPAAAQSQAEIVALAEEAKNFQSVMDELAQTGRMLAQTLMPLVNILKTVLNFIQLLSTEIPVLGRVLPAVTLAVGLLTIAFRNLSKEVLKANKGPLGLAIAGFTILLMALQSESTTMQVVLGLLGAAFIGLSIAVAAGFVTMQVGSAGILTAIGLLATLILSIADIFMHKAASPGFITILGMVGKAFKTLGTFMFPIVGIFNMLSSAIMGSAKAAHDLDGTKVEMSTTTNATATSSTVAQAGAGRINSTTTARNASGRINSANASAAAATATTGGSTAGATPVDVNVAVKADEGDLIKLIVKTIEQVNSYKDSGLRANANTIRNRI